MIIRYKYLIPSFSFFFTSLAFPLISPCYADFSRVAQVKQHNVSAIEKLSLHWINNGGLEIITGGPSSSRIQSQWGHTSIRFVGSGTTPIEDIVVEALALNPPKDDQLDVIYEGLTGGYPIVLFFRSMSYLIQYYYYIELRGFTRTIIPTTRQTRLTLLKTLQSINESRSGKDKYLFIGNNCTSYIARVLAAAGFYQIELPRPFIPTRMNLHLRRSYLSPWPEVHGISISDLRALEEKIKNDDISKWATLELQKLTVFSGFALGDNILKIFKELDQRTDHSLTEDVYGLNKLPNSMYQRTQEFEPTLRDSIKDLFDKDQLDFVNMYNRATWFTTYNSDLCKHAPLQCTHFKRSMNLMLELE